jgi:hypothetical protein
MKHPRINSRKHHNTRGRAFRPAPGYPSSTFFTPASSGTTWVRSGTSANAPSADTRALASMLMAVGAEYGVERAEALVVLERRRSVPRALLVARRRAPSQAIV